MHSGLLKFCLALAAALAATPSTFACTAPKVLEDKAQAHPDADIFADIGTWFGDRKQYDCALEAFQKGLKLEPGSAKLYYLIGLTLYASGHPDEALQPLAKSIYLMPDVLKPHLLLASAMDQLQRREDARREWSAALRIDSKSVEAFDGIAKSLIADGDYASAIEVLREGPRNETLTLDLALAYGKGNMLDKAAEVLTQALQKTPSSFALTSALVTVYVRQVHYQDAVHLAEKQARLHPANLDAQRLYLRVLVLDGDSATARPVAHKLLAAHPHDFDFLYLNGILENQEGKYPIARTHLQEAVKLNPDYYNARYNLGVALLELKDPEGAREQFEKALELGATEPEVRFKYATALRNLGQTDKAKEQLKLYQEQIQANEKRALSNSKTAQADKEMESGETEKAIADYREALEATPQDAHLAYKMAMALDKKGDAEGERAALEEAIKTDPGFALAQNQLGYLDSKDGDSASAEEHFRAAVKAAPAYTQAWISLAATLGMESRYSEAQQALSSALKLEPENADALQLRKDLDAAQQPR
ncbi:MAG: tetratricopeptide repeat protein [Candidatus Sulfotelmatobacter sp.]